MTVQSSLAVNIAGVGFSFPWLPEQTDIALPPTGTVCDPYSLQDDNVLTPVRYATGYFKGTVTGNGNPIVFAAQSLTLFSDGPGETSANTGKVNVNGVALALNDADTNSFDEGSLVPNTSEWWLNRGMGFRVNDVCTFNTDGSRNVDPKRLFYTERINKVVASTAFASMRYENTKTTSDLGLPVDWPAMGQMYNAADTVSISDPVVGGMMGFVFPWFAGSRCACNLINVFLDLPAFNVISDSTGPGGGTLDAEQYLASITCDLYGAVFCVDWMEAAILRAAQLRISQGLRASGKLGAEEFVDLPAVSSLPDDLQLALKRDDRALTKKTVHRDNYKENVREKTRVRS